jgi:hypothetical protein
MDLEQLLELLGPEYKSQYQMNIADAIIDALMGRQEQGQGQKKPQAQAQTQTQGGAGQPAPMGAMSGMGSANPLISRMFNTAPETMQRLLSSITGARRGMRGGF